MLSVLISGVGIAGPTLAYWLAAGGFQATLVERAPQLRRGGYAIDFWGLGYDIAERMGLLADLRQRAYRVEELRFVDREGRRVGGFPVDVFRTLTNERYLTIPRSALAEAIYNTIESRCEVMFGNFITAVEHQQDGVTVHFAHAPPRAFDLLVGADGLHSAVRHLAFGSENRFERYLGYGVAAFEAAHYRPRDERAYVTLGLPGKQIGRFALRDDRTLFLLVLRLSKARLPDHDDHPAQKALLREAFEHAGWECASILDAADHADDFYFDAVSQIELEHWSNRRVALIGDAAFAPSLLAGQGSALAMTSAYVLAGELVAAQDQPELAVARYEHLLRGFIDGKQRAAARFAGSFVPKTALGLFIRNQLSKALRYSALVDLLVGRDLLDRLVLPEYSFSDRPCAPP